MFSDNHSRFADLCNQDNLQRLAANKLMGLIPTDGDSTSNTIITQHIIDVGKIEDAAEKISEINTTLKEAVDTLSITDHAPEPTNEVADTPNPFLPTKEEKASLITSRETEAYNPKLHTEEQKTKPEPKRINIMEDAVSETSGREDACSVHSHGKDEESKDQNHDERSKDRSNTYHRHEDEFDLDGDLSEAEIRERKLMYLVDIEDFAEEGIATFPRGLVVNIHSDLKTIELCHAAMEIRSAQASKMAMVKDAMVWAADIYGAGVDYVRGNKGPDKSDEWREQFGQHIEHGKHDPPVRRFVRKYNHVKGPEEFTLLSVIYHSKRKYDVRRKKEKTQSATNAVKNQQMALDALEKQIQDAPF